MTPKGRNTTGQATVEFALCATVFFMIIFGTIDLGRVVFLKSQLDNAVREGARYGKIHETDISGVKAKVVSYSNSGLTTSGVTVTCSTSCTTGGTMTVTATVTFSAFTQSLLKISPITLTSTATVDIE
jgi:Flp pilus assembly protein TadG